MKRRGGPAIAAAAMLIGAALFAASPCSAQIAPPAEPDGYRLSDYRTATPATLQGAAVVDDEGAHALWLEGRAVFIDVFPRPPRPANLPEGSKWRHPPRMSIPKAVWLPNTGFGTIEPDVEAYFRANLERLTGGDKAAPLVVFCQSNCWMSWNAAKRAAHEYGYSQVIWYPRGADGWEDAGRDLERVEPEPN